MARLGVVAALAVAAMLCVAVHAEVFFQEDFTGKSWLCLHALHTSHRCLATVCTRTTRRGAKSLVRAGEKPMRGPGGLVLIASSWADGWEDRWVKSKFKSGDEGPWELSAGKFYGDADNKGNSVQLLSRPWHRPCAQCIARDSEAGR